MPPETTPARAARPREKIIAVVGPTASGKTALAIALAKKFNGEIISADSRQIYRGMDIGTAKPTRAEQRAVPHHVIDIRDPNESYTVAEFQHDAIAAIHAIIARGRLPMLVGGTGLYVKAVVENLDIPRVAADPALRARLEADVRRHGLAAMFDRLVKLDPEAAYVVDPKNPRRVIRALEVTLTTGVPFTAQRRKRAPRFSTLMLGVAVPPTALRRRINQRIDAMEKAGLAREVRKLVKKYSSKANALDAIGYREIIQYLEGNATLKQALDEMKISTWHYAKRQMTWFKKDATVRWIKNQKEALAQIKNFLKRIPEK